MKHAGSSDRLKAQAGLSRTEGPVPFAPGLASQSLLSRLLVLAGALLLVAVVADGPVLSLARSLDPSARAWLRLVTGFGNSAWPLGSGILLLGLVGLARRSQGLIRPEALAACRSLMILLVASVAISGLLASLTKHMIGRIRPSEAPDAMVLEFSLMAFSTGWAAFPSGHATTATAAAVVLAIGFPRHAWAWLTLGGLAALSRALLGVHWLTDCLAGMLLGTLVATALHRRMTMAGHRFEIAPGTLTRLALAALSALHRIATRAASRRS